MNIKPIHNVKEGGLITECHKCGKKISEGKTGHLYCKEHGGEKWGYYLERKDGVIHRANRAVWIEWKSEGWGREEHKEPKIGRSLYLDFGYLNFNWTTTVVREIYKQSDNEIHFRTTDTEYILRIYE